MGGGFIQLISYGAQDIYLTGNPQITFFKLNFKRYTNFSIENIEYSTAGVTNYKKKFSITIDKNIDLINKCYLKVNILQGALFITLQDLKKFYKEPGNQLVKSIEIQIGGQVIDKHYGTWLSIWNELSLEYSKKNSYKILIGEELTYDNINNDEMVSSEVFPISLSNKHLANVYIENRRLVPNDVITLYIPLNFWFCKFIGTSLPVVALQYNKIRFNIELNDITSIIKNYSRDDYIKDDFSLNGTGNDLGIVNNDLYIPRVDNVSILANGIILDTDEKRNFVTQSHEYLIEQLQYQEESSPSIETILKFHYPIKELIWVFQSNTPQNPLDFSVGDGINAPLSQLKLVVNGFDKFRIRDGRYFSEVQPYQHHSNIPEVPGIYVYSFSLYPEEHQPSGTLNFSRLNNVKFEYSLTENMDKIKIFAINYNVFKVISGMGGLAFST
jgi:hypothetical protein